MLNVALDDRVIKWPAVELGFRTFYASKLYQSSSLFVNMYYPTSYVSDIFELLLGKRLKETRWISGEFTTLQLCSLSAFLAVHRRTILVASSYTPAFFQIHAEGEVARTRLI